MAGNTSMQSEALALAQSCGCYDPHTRQVTRLSLLLFDYLTPLHGLGAQERLWLECAAIIHDAGWVEGRKAHHKASLNLVLNSPLLSWNNKERLIVGSIARYHRKSLPSLKHDHYRTLDKSEQKIVSVCAACLRLADGLDNSHEAWLRDLRVEIKPKSILLHCMGEWLPVGQEEMAIEKSDLAALIFDRDIRISLEAFND